jgi:AraC family transcriptional regulator
MNPGEFHLLTHGEHNTPRWLQPFEEISLVLDPRFVADLVEGGLPADRIEFESRHSTYDPAVARYADAFRRELAADPPEDLLRAETLTVGLALHLLSTYAAARPRIRSPRGKLSASQLRTVVDFIETHLDEDVSLLVLARRAEVSPFHFARQFRATVGVTPHQFVLWQRVYKSVRLIKAGALPLAQIALESGFHDQPHFTRAFRKVLGTTPGRYSSRR